MSDPQIHIIDLNFSGEPQTIASYLIEGPEGPVLVETGPTSTLDALRAGLGEHGYQLTDIRHALVTHIHFDHAGASGSLAQNGTKIYVHDFGARHLINPERLLLSARRIYGDAMDDMWGEMVPASATNVVSIFDGDIVAVAGLEFQVTETPGHARHHHVYRLGNIAFVGDTGGTRLGSFNLLDFPAPPPEFDLENWHHSIDKVLAMGLTTIYPTHFGPVNDVESHLTDLKALISEAAELIRIELQAGMQRDEILKSYTAWHRQRGLQAGLDNAALEKYYVATPPYMSVDGMIRYWTKQATP